MTYLQGKLLVAFHERHQSLLSDGYRDIINSNNDKWHYIKMHHNNGTYISLTAYYDDNSIIQRTNGKVTHCEKMCKP